MISEHDGLCTKWKEQLLLKRCYPNESLLKRTETLAEPVSQMLKTEDAVKLLYDNAVKLVIHDDTLNWTKFYNMLYFNLALAGGYALLSDKGYGYVLYAVCALGIAIGWLFLLTLREGMRCLRSHRIKVSTLDKCAVTAYREEFLFAKNVYNRRDALHWGPVWMIAFWCVVLVLTYLHINHSGFIGLSNRGISIPVPW